MHQRPAILGFLGFASILGAAVSLSLRVRIDDNFVCGNAVGVLIQGVPNHGGEEPRAAAPAHVVDACRNAAATYAWVALVFLGLAFLLLVLAWRARVAVRAHLVDPNNGEAVELVSDKFD